MLNRIRTPLTLAAAIALGTPALAHADTLCSPVVTNHVCVTAKFTLTGNNVLNVFLYNGESATTTWASTLTIFEIAGLPGPTSSWALTSVGFNDWNGTSLVSDGNNNLASLGGWGVGGSPSIGLSGYVISGNGPSGNGGISTCAGPFGAGIVTTCQGGGAFGASDDWMRFSFTYTPGGLTNASLALIEWGFKVQAAAGLNGNSFECNSAAASTSTTYCVDTPDDPGTPQDVVPEPATLTLLATGLVGLGAKRRRRKS